jgi:hypothetical protein
LLKIIQAGPGISSTKRRFSRVLEVGVVRAVLVLDEIWIVKFLEKGGGTGRGIVRGSREIWRKRILTCMPIGVLVRRRRLMMVMMTMKIMKVGGQMFLGSVLRNECANGLKVGRVWKVDWWEVDIIRREGGWWRRTISQIVELRDSHGREGRKGGCGGGVFLMTGTDWFEKGGKGETRDKRGCEIKTKIKKKKIERKKGREGE